MMARLDAIEAKLDAAERRQRFDDEHSPAGTVLWGGAYGWDGRAIFKQYSGVMRTMGDEYDCIVAVHVASYDWDWTWAIDQIPDDVVSGPTDDYDEYMECKERILRERIMLAVPAVIGVDFSRGVFFMDGSRARTLAGLIDAAREAAHVLIPRDQEETWDWCGREEVHIEMVQIAVWNVLVDKKTGRRRPHSEVLKAASGSWRMTNEAAGRMQAATPPDGYKCISRDLLRALASPSSARSTHGPRQRGLDPDQRRRCTGPMNKHGPLGRPRDVLGPP